MLFWKNVKNTVKSNQKQFVGGVFYGLGTIAAGQAFTLLSLGVKIIGERFVEKIHDRNRTSDSHFDEEFWDELFDDETDGKEGE